MDYCKLAEDIYTLIDGELKRAESGEEVLSVVYPKLVVCYEFYRYIRGEYFLSIRPLGTTCQKMMYSREDQIGDRLSKLRTMLGTTDPSVKIDFLG